jgi:Arrestin (or S-antigen), C-terminal domain
VETIAGFDLTPSNGAVRYGFILNFVVPADTDFMSGSIKRSFFSKRVSSDQDKQSRFLRSSDIDFFHRPISALAKHRIHQLSDIREVSGSSKGVVVKKQCSSQLDGMKTLPCTPEAQRDATSGSPSSEYMTPIAKNQGEKHDSKGLGSRAASAMSLPLRDVPERRSSASIFAQSLHGSRKASLQELPTWPMPPTGERTEPSSLRGRSDSPVRRALHKSTQSSQAMRSSPSRTFIRTTPPLDILDKGCIRNDRVELSAHLPSPLFVGGGTIEGHIKLEVSEDNHSKKNKFKQVSISRLSLDVIGVEEVNDGRRWVFLSLGSELLDDSHPPPPALVDSKNSQLESELSWTLKHASAVIPFCINLPLNLGPPPYLSRQASIRYILSPTAHIKVGEKRTLVRQTWNIQMLTVHDPEKALASLASPLLAADSLTMSHAAELHTVKLTAGLHRQTWVNGGKVFVDVHVVNSTPRTMKKIEIQLEKITLWYSHAAAGTAEKSATHLRLPKRSDAEVVSTTAIRKSKEWKGVSAYTSEVRTCELEAPQSHVTISTGRYFEVRYFINVIVSISMFKSCAVQLPVTLIHMNSLDILPNSLAQVAASIEAKRARTVPTRQDQPVYQPYYQGQAFTAPRRQSLERVRNGSAIAPNDISLLTQDLDNSPRRYSNVHGHGLGRQSTVVRRENIAPSHPSSSHHHHKHHPSCYHCHLLYTKESERPGTAMSKTSQIGPKLPRLQVSTSGLGFSESEFEVPADSPPRKVMLSEQERKMINQQRQLKMQRQWSQRNRNASIDQVHAGRGVAKILPTTFKNVAADPDARPKQPAIGNLSQGAPRPQSQFRIPRRTESSKRKTSAHRWPKMNSERVPPAATPTDSQRGRESVDLPTRGLSGIEGDMASAGIVAVPRPVVRTSTDKLR